MPEICWGTGARISAKLTISWAMAPKCRCAGEAPDASSAGKPSQDRRRTKRGSGCLDDSRLNPSGKHPTHPGKGSREKPASNPLNVYLMQ